MVKCNTCGGSYEPTLADGTQYFHACPPLSAAEIRQGLDDGTLRLSRADQQRLADAKTQDDKEPVAADQPTRADLVLASIGMERPNRRDENVASTADHGDQPARIKAEGLGTRLVPAP